MLKNRKSSVLQIASYAAPYKGNFIESLECLSNRLENSLENIYFLPHQQTNSMAFSWVDELRKNDRTIYESPKNNIKYINELRRIIKKHNVKIIHTHFITLKEYLNICCATLFTRVKIVMHFHNHPSHKEGIANIARRIIYRRAYMVACSDSVLESLRMEFPMNESSVVENGIFFNRISSGAVATREEYNLKEDTVLCLMFGFDFYRKGVDVVVKSLEKLNQNQISYELLISLTKNFETVENEIKKILGSIPSWIHIIQAKANVEELYNLCDTFISASREEGFCYSAIEAAYCGCNTIASKIPAQGDLRIPGAYWFECENVEDLAKCIEISGKKNMTDVSEIKCSLVTEYDVKRWVERIIVVYEKLGLKK